MAKMATSQTFFSIVNMVHLCNINFFVAQNKSDLLNIKSHHKLKLNAQLLTVKFPH